MFDFSYSLQDLFHEEDHSPFQEENKEEEHDNYSSRLIEDQFSLNFKKKRNYFTTKPYEHYKFLGKMNNKRKSTKEEDISELMMSLDLNKESKHRNSTSDAGNLCEKIKINLVLAKDSIEEDVSGSEEDCHYYLDSTFIKEVKVYHY